MQKYKSCFKAHSLQILLKLCEILWSMGSYLVSKLHCFSVQLPLSISKNSFFSTSTLMFLYAFIYFSHEDSDDIMIEPAKLRTRDSRDNTSQESQIPELPVSNIRMKETQALETTESKVVVFFYVVLLRILLLIIKVDCKSKPFFGCFYDVFITW